MLFSNISFTNNWQTTAFTAILQISLLGAVDLTTSNIKSDTNRTTTRIALFAASVFATAFALQHPLSRRFSYHIDSFQKSLAVSLGSALLYFIPRHFISKAAADKAANEQAAPKVINLARSTPIVRFAKNIKLADINRFKRHIQSIQIAESNHAINQSKANAPSFRGNNTKTSF